MDFESLKKEFDTMFAAVSDAELVAAFAAMGCEVELVEANIASEWVRDSVLSQDRCLVESMTASNCSIICFGGWGRLETSGKLIERNVVEPNPVGPFALTVDSNELALAA